MTGHGRRGLGTSGLHNVFSYVCGKQVLSVDKYSESQSATLSNQASISFNAGDPSPPTYIAPIDRKAPPGITMLNLPRSSTGKHSFCNAEQELLHVFIGWQVSEQRGTIVSQMSALNLGRHFW